MKGTTMGIADDLKIEAAVQAALAGSADARALALVQIAVDPAGTKARLEELTAATRAHDAARETAETDAAEAEAKVTDAEARQAEVVRRESEANAWIEQTKKNLNEREAACRAAEEAVARRERDCKNSAADLATKFAEHRALMARLRLHLDQFAGEAHT
jgi:chromosome segregation ATPase